MTVCNQRTVQVVLWRHQSDHNRTTPWLLISTITFTLIVKAFILSLPQAERSPRNRDATNEQSQSPPLQKVLA